MIPRRLYSLADLLIIAGAFVGSFPLVRFVTPLIAPGGAWHADWYFDFFPDVVLSGQLQPMSNLLWMWLVVASSVLGVLSVLGGYRPPLDLSPWRIIGGATGASLAGVSLVALALFAFKPPHASRLFLFSFGLFSAIGLASLRLLLRTYFKVRQRAGYYARNVVLIGPAHTVKRLLQYFDEHIPTTEYQIYGYLLDDGPQRADNLPGPQAIQTGHRGLGRPEDLGELFIHQPITEVIAVQPTSGGDWMHRCVQDCDYFGVLLRIVPESLLSQQPRSLRAIIIANPTGLPSVALAPRNWDTEALFIKRLIDIGVSLTLLILLAPLFLLIAIAIKVTTPRLPVFYPWRVVGYKGVIFTGYKFSTMVLDADVLKATLMEKNEMTGPVFKIKADPRVTSLGRFLRKYSLNELPQLWSTLKGDMSLVGPRPAWPHELERYKLWHKRKLSVRPGITCFWQVRGRNKISDFDDWVKMDLEYIDNWSLWLDAKILARTFWVVLIGSGS